MRPVPIALILSLSAAIQATSTTAFAASTAMSRPASQEERIRIARELIESRANADRPGLIASVVQHGKPVFTAAAGLADLNIPHAIDERTAFHTGSVGKQFTAFAAQLLIAEGKLSLDLDVRSLVPYLKQHAEPITVGNLIYHTSGLKDVWYTTAIGVYAEADSIYQSYFQSLFARQTSLNFQPGTNFEYSNTGYTVLADVVEAAAERPFSEFVDDRIFRPLGMTDSLVHDLVGKVVPNGARPYQFLSNDAALYHVALQSNNRGLKGSAWREVPLTYAVYGMGAIYISARDLGIWLQNLMTPIPEHAEAAAAMRTTGRLSNGAEINYASGIIKTTVAGANAFTHSGHDQEFFAIATFFPDTGHSIVVLANSQQENREVRDALTTLFVDDANVEKIPPEPRSRAGKKQRKAALGAYQAAEGLALIIEERGDGLHLWDGDEGWVPLTLLEDGRFYFGDWRGAFDGTIEGRGADAVVTTPLPDAPERLRRSIRYAKLPAAAEKTPREALVGTYYSNELNSLITIEESDDDLVLRHPRAIADYPLRSIGGDAYIMDPLDSWAIPYTIEFDVRNDAARGFAIHCVMSQNVGFVRIDTNPLNEPRTAANTY